MTTETQPKEPAHVAYVPTVAGNPRNNGYCSPRKPGKVVRSLDCLFNVPPRFQTDEYIRYTRTSIVLDGPLPPERRERPQRTYESHVFGAPEVPAPSAQPRELPPMQKQPLSRYEQWTTDVKQDYLKKHAAGEFLETPGTLREGLSAPVYHKRLTRYSHLQTGPENW